MMKEMSHRTPIIYLQMGYSTNFLWSMLFISCVAIVVKYSEETLEEPGCRGTGLTDILVLPFLSPSLFIV